MSCRAKWNAYTEDQLLHNGQGTGNGQYWEQHVKQVWTPPAAESDLGHQKYAAHWDCAMMQDIRTQMPHTLCFRVSSSWLTSCPMPEKHCDYRLWLPRLTSGAQQSRRQILTGSLHRSTSTTCWASEPHRHSLQSSQQRA